MEAPDDRRYSKEHEWVVSQDDGTALVGVSDFAQNQLGDVVFVELPKVGAALAQFDQMGEIESVKAVSDLYTPVGGEVVEVNADVVANAGTGERRPLRQGLAHQGADGQRRRPRQPYGRGAIRSADRLAGRIPSR